MDDELPVESAPSLLSSPFLDTAGSASRILFMYSVKRLLLVHSDCAKLRMSTGVAGFGSQWLVRSLLVLDSESEAPTA